MIPFNRGWSDSATADGRNWVKGLGGQLSVDLEKIESEFPDQFRTTVDAVALTNCYIDVNFNDPPQDDELLDVDEIRIAGLRQLIHSQDRDTSEYIVEINRMRIRIADLVADRKRLKRKNLELRRSRASLIGWLCLIGTCVPGMTMYFIWMPR